MNIIYSDGTQATIGMFDTSNTNNTQTIDKLAINMQNELLVFFNNNTVLKCGTLKNDNYTPDSTLLIYEKLPNENAYAVCGVYNKALTEIVIPATHKGLPVTEISPYAFHGNQTIQKIYLGSNVHTIGVYAFENCTNLKLIHFGESMKNINYCAFANTPSLIIIQSKVQKNSISLQHYFGDDLTFMQRDWTYVD